MKAQLDSGSDFVTTERLKTKRLSREVRYPRRAVAFSVVLAVLALGLFLIKTFLLGVSVGGGGQPGAVVLEQKFQASSEKGVFGTAIMHVPREEPGQLIGEEKVLSMRRAHSFKETPSNRLLEVRVDPGQSVKLYYRAAINLFPRRPVQYSGPVEGRWLSIKDRSPEELPILAKTANDLGVIGAKRETAKAVLDYIRKFSADGSQAARSLDRLLKKGSGNPDDINAFHIDLSRAAGLPTRRVVGLTGTSTGSVETSSWVEHLIDGAWCMAIPERNELCNIGEGVISLYRGESPQVYGRNLKKVEAGFNLMKDVYARQDDTNETKGFFGAISLTRLPVDTQKTVRVLLAVPLAALAVVIFRLIFGGRTVGTFLPIILAMSFRYTELGPGLAMQAAVLLIGVMALAAFNRMGLQKIPSSSLMVSVIVLVFAFIALAGEAFGIYRLEQIAFFPIIITTLMVQRVSRELFEKGIRDMAFLYTGTIFVTAMSYLIITSGAIQVAFLVFPELELLVMSLTIAVALISGKLKGKPVHTVFKREHPVVAG